MQICLGYVIITNFRRVNTSKNFIEMSKSFNVNLFAACLLLSTRTPFICVLIVKVVSIIPLNFALMTKWLLLVIWVSPICVQKNERQPLGQGFWWNLLDHLRINYSIVVLFVFLRSTHWIGFPKEGVKLRGVKYMLGEIYMGWNGFGFKCPDTESSTSTIFSFPNFQVITSESG